MNKNRKITIVFADQKLKKAFHDLKKGKGAEPQLYEFINRAFDDLEKNPNIGMKIPRKLWPKDYIKKYEIDNLWKYDLPSGWRLIYTLKANQLAVIAVVLEWFDHKEYERRFKY
ncbi:MAG: type II toxin-antitoxin system RelE/ParE family toxin [Candidatus Micrarchaeia archaeon]